ncbi:MULTISPECIES: hypothetical protein [unclassified Bradyrhizobium]|uniref:hypothetical protein n=1 Tax=unclassified Bradyrhizobium TaxID=2631580 RepID=UPI002915D1BF|nr:MULTISPECIES: hypothetical protein [unclassified Bradyrhizobium]
MIPLEGRALAGLDEFMLRAGHLSAICRVATTDGGAAFRFERAVTSKFCELVPVRDEMKPAFARYLRVKGLSPVEANAKGVQDRKTEYRYPALRVVDPGKPGETVASEDGEIRGQWQDVSLADPGVPSKVGAISFGGKRGSKTGLSHLFDWGGMLGLFSDSGALTNFGQLIGKFFDVVGTPDANPYVLGQERLIFGFLIVREDFDMFATLVDLLAVENETLRKQSAMRLYVRAVTLLSEKAEASRDLSQGRRQDLFSLWREVKPKRDGDDQITSTAWHRIAARLENLVDLGLLKKEPSEQYEYKYRQTENLLRAKHALATSASAAEWIDRHLVDVLTGERASDDRIAPNDLEPLLSDLLPVLSRPMSPLPLDVVANGVAALSLRIGKPVTFGAARRSLEGYAVELPARARLSAGATRRAEYISIDAALWKRSGA